MTPSDKNERIYCNICPSVFNQPGHLKIHVRSAHMEVKHQCLQCNKYFGYKHHLKKHVEEIHVGKTYECEECNHKVSSKSGIKQHKMSVHKKIVFKCTVEDCDFEAKAKYYLKIHVRNFHQGEKNFPCSFCNHKSSRKCDLQRHIEHKHESPKKCTTCNKNYSTQKGLLEHKQRLHENNFTLKSCQFCNFSAKANSNLKRHIRIHHMNINTSLSVCSICSKTLNSKTSLKTHMDAVHLKVKHKCDICDKEFSFQRALQRHNERFHSDAIKNLIKCNLCPYVTLSNVNFNRHMNIHK